MMMTREAAVAILDQQCAHEHALAAAEVGHRMRRRASLPLWGIAAVAGGGYALSPNIILGGVCAVAVLVAVTIGVRARLMLRAVQSRSMDAQFDRSLRGMATVGVVRMEGQYLLVAEDEDGEMALLGGIPEDDPLARWFSD